jgi:hypothetical protein
MRHTSQPRTAVRVKAVKDDKARRVHQTIVAFAAASAVALCAMAMARADETWVTVNPDGTVTRSTTSTIQPSPSPAVTNVTVQVAPQVPNTTFFSGTYYPVPQYYTPYPPAGYGAPPVYTYQTPGGITYPVGPQIPGFQAPMITTLPSTGVGFGYPAYPGYPPYPAYSYPTPYPLYGTTGTYYSGPAGGGGTITSSSSTSNSGLSIGYGKRGWKVKGGHGLSTKNSTTTVTTYR